MTKLKVFHEGFLARDDHVEIVEYQNDTCPGGMTAEQKVRIREAWHVANGTRTEKQEE